MPLCRWLEARGARTPYGNAVWNPTSVRRMLANRVYLGEARSGAFVKTAAHSALTDPVTFQRAQRPRELAACKGAEPSLLGGLVRCAACSLAMRAFTARTPDGRVRRHYSCPRRCAGGHCHAPASMTGSRLELLVEQAFFELASQPSRPPSAELEAAERAVGTAEAALVRYRDNDRIARAIGPERYAEGLARRSRQQERALLALGDARARSDPDALESAEALERRWPGMTVRDRRVAIAALIECVFVLRGQGPAAGRVAVCRRGEGPPALPRRGALGAVPRPFDPDSCPRAPRWPTGIRAPWDERRLSGELEDFLQDRAEWPAWETFNASGRARLHEQVVLQGGADVWARRLGIAPRPAVLRRPWTDERIRATLSLYLSDRVRFPTPAEFRADGLAHPRDAITAQGGVDRWAHEFGLPPPHRLRGAQTWWTDERIDAELRRFTEGRAVFPTQREFRHANRGALLAALRRHGGMAPWAARLGLPRRQRYSGRVAG